MLNNFNTLKIKKKHGMLFPLLLCLLPLIALNIGYIFIEFIDIKSKKENQINIAQNELQGLTTNSSFELQLDKYTNSFYEKLKEYAISLSKTKNAESIFKHQLISAAKKLNEEIFPDSFPKYKIYVFYCPIINKITPDYIKNSTIYTNQKSNYKNNLHARTFINLVQDYGNDNIFPNYKSNEKLINGVLRFQLIESSVISKTQKSKLIYCLYNKKPHRFVWDFITLDNKAIFGYYCLCENNIENDIITKQIALKNLSLKIPNVKSAFIPLFSHSEPILYSDKQLESSKLFNNWVKENISIEKEDILDIRNSNKSFPTNQEIGKYTCYTYLGFNQTHLSAILYPNIPPFCFPDWLYVINTILCFTIGLFILRGILFGIWPTISLKQRFTMSYILASTLPISFLTITFYIYIMQYEESSLIQETSELQTCINSFDAQKNIMFNGYSKLFYSILNDKILNNMLKKDILTKIEITERIKNLLNSYPDYPVKSITIFDEKCSGHIITYNTPIDSPDSINKYSPLNGKYNSFNYNIDQLKMLKNDDRSVTTLLLCYSELLQEIKGIKVELNYDTFHGNILQGYQHYSNHELKDDMRDQIGKIVSENIEGRTSYNRIFDYIKIDNKPQYGLLIRFKNNAIDQSTLNLTYNKLALTNPNFVFALYKAQNNKIDKQLTKSHHDKKIKNFDKNALELANKAIISHKKEILHTDDYLFIAVNANKFENYIIVGALDKNYINKNTFFRYTIFTTILLTSFIIFFICNYISNKIFLEPIENIKEALDKVSKDELDIELKCNSIDEIGEVSHEFSIMTQGLRERKRLATLISDQALNAINTGDFSTESFNGVALVSDIRNFTGTCEKYNPNLITNLLNIHFAEMTKIILEHGGRIYKYIGDAIEAIFPEDDRYKDTASKRAFNAASKMIIKLYQINQKRRKEKLFTYKIGVGLKYGLMHSGTVGSIDTRMDYAILGEPLKIAAKLESFSIKNPSFPIVIDERISKELINNGLNFEELKDVEYKSFILTEIGKITPTEETGQNEKSTLSSNTDYNKYNGLKRININSSIGFLKKSHSLIASFLLIAIIYISILYSYISIKNKYIKDEKTNANQLCSRYIEQAQINNLALFSFENQCRKLVKQLEELANKNKKEFEKQLKLRLDNEIGKHKKIRILTASINNSNPKEELKYSNVFYKHGFTDKNKNIDKTLTEAWQFPTYKHNINKIKKYIGNNALKYIIKSEDKSKSSIDSSNVKIEELNYLPYWKLVNLRSTAQISNLGNDNIFVFWDYIYDYDKVEDPVYNNIKVSDKLGWILIVYPTSDYINNIENIANGLENKNSNIFVALKEINTNNAEYTYSNNFPNKIKNNIKNTNEEYALSNSTIEIANTSYELNIIKKISNTNNISDILLKLILTFIFLITCFTVKKTLNNQSFINTSIKTKIWLIQLIVAFIPIVTIIFLIELYSKETKTVSIANKHENLQNFALNFENKANITAPASNLIFEKISHSKELETIINNTNKKLYNAVKNNKNENEIIEANKKEIIEYLSKYFDIKKNNSNENDYSDCILPEVRTPTFYAIRVGKHYKLLNKDPKSKDYYEPYSNNCFIRNIIVASLDYVVNTGAQSNDDKSKFFNLVIEAVAKKQTKSNTDKEKILKFEKSDQKTDEIQNTLMTHALEAVKNVFGVEAYIKLPHAINSPIAFSVDANTYTTVIYISNKSDDIPYSLLLNYVVDRDVANIAYKYNLSVNNMDELMFMADTQRFGNLRTAPFIRDRQDIKQTLGMVTYSNLPISTELKIHNDKNKNQNINDEFIVEGGLCLKNQNFAYLCMANISSINNKISFYRNLLYSSLLFIIVIIALISRNIANDSVIPIQALIYGMLQTKAENYTYRIDLNRKDELGVLCNTFDKMMKGLEEKYLMSKMVSNTAQNATFESKEQKSNRSDCVILYVSIQNFNKYMDSMTPNNLFTDLKKQVSSIAKIVIETGGEIDKIIGDKMLIAFHVTDTKNLQNCVYSACQTALKIVKEESIGNLPFPVSIGINCGSVVTGFLGVGEKRDFTIIGDPVNVSARIASYAETQRFDRCLISENVYNISKNFFGGSFIGEIPLKGKSEPMKVYHLVKDIRIQS